jgi:hypothetical protein
MLGGNISPSKLGSVLLQKGGSVEGLPTFTMAQAEVPSLIPTALFKGTASRDKACFFGIKIENKKKKKNINKIFFAIIL